MINGEENTGGMDLTKYKFKIPAFHFYKIWQIAIQIKKKNKD
jgi:hypothetical protein